MKDRDQQLIWEAYDSRKPGLVPPKSLSECVALIKQYMNNPDEEWNTNDGEVSGIDEWIAALPKEDYRHEAIHALQMKEWPGWIESFGEIDLPPGDFGKLPAEQMVSYYSRPPEIMAFAFDVASGHPKAQENIDIYQKIGGDVFELFNKYIQEYKQKL